MSSSPSRSPLATPAAAGIAAPVRETSPFHYREMPTGTGMTGAGVIDARGVKPPAIEEVVQTASDSVEREARARRLGREEGQAESGKAFEDQLGKERSALGAALTQFARDRALYYQNVETEVVQLALSVARHIIHREAQIDPLLLAAVARVALEKIEKATGVTLRIHPHNAEGWRRFFSLHLDPADVPEIVEDPSISTDGCILETSMGAAELGMEIQLKEIETGLMDLLAARPEK